MRFNNTRDLFALRSLDSIGIFELDDLGSLPPLDGGEVKKMGVFVSHLKPLNPRSLMPKHGIFLPKVFKFSLMLFFRNMQMRIETLLGLILDKAQLVFGCSDL